MFFLLSIMISKNPSSLPSISSGLENSQAQALFLLVCFKKTLATEMLKIWWKFLGQVSYLSLETFYQCSSNHIPNHFAIAMVQSPKHFHHFTDRFYLMLWHMDAQSKCILTALPKSYSAIGRSEAPPYFRRSNTSFTSLSLRRDTFGTFWLYFLLMGKPAEGRDFEGVPEGHKKLPPKFYR